MRSTWKGFLKISLVTIPIRVFPATESAAALSFNQLHGECQTRIQQKRWCPQCAREVPSSELVKGYEVERGRYVVLEADDLEAVQVPSTKVIDLVQFADEDALDPMLVDRAYYLAPDGAMAAQAYAVMAQGLVEKIGVGKLALYGREYLVAIRSVFDRGRGGRTLVLYTLHHAGEIRSMAAIDELQRVPVIADRAEVKLARQIIDALEQPLDLSTYRDEYRASLQRIIDAKIAGEQVVTPPTPAPAVINLSEALARSLAAISTTKKKPAKAMGKKKRRIA